MINSMSIVSIPTTRKPYDSDLLAILELETKKLRMMERQYSSGENMELPIATLDEWRINILQQRLLVKELQRMFNQAYHSVV